MTLAMEEAPTPHPKLPGPLLDNRSKTCNSQDKGPRVWGVCNLFHSPAPSMSHNNGKGEEARWGCNDIPPGASGLSIQHPRMAAARNIGARPGKGLEVGRFIFSLGGRQRQSECSRVVAWERTKVTQPSEF